MGSTVLVVDDEYLIRETLVTLLRDEGYTVYEAPEGRPALERLRAHPAGMVVVLDVNMPGVDGIAVMQAVEAEASVATRHAYIVLSADGRILPVAFVQQLTRLHIPVIAKPFDVDKLVVAIAVAADRLQAEA